MPTALKVGYIPFVALAAGAFALGFYQERFTVVVSYLKEYILYIVLLLGTTSIIYFLEQSEQAQITRGYEKIAYQALTVLITVAAYYMFGKKAMDYTFYGFVLFFLIAIVFALREAGFAGAVNDFLFFLKSGGDAQGFMKDLELHDAVFGFGIFLVYYAVLGIKKNKGKFLVASIFFLLGMKRIGIIAVIVAILLFHFVRKKKEKAYRNVIIIGIIILVFGFLYILSTRYGWVRYFSEQLGIDTMGRNELYEFIEQYYNINVLFHGHGFEFVTQLMKSATLLDFNMAKIGAIHNGYLTIYLEFGFLGYFLWNGFWLIWHPLWMKRQKYETDVVLAYLAISVYLFLTYATDNTAFYFSTGIVARLVPILFSETSRYVTGNGVCD